MPRRLALSTVVRHGRVDIAWNSFRKADIAFGILSGYCRAMHLAGTKIRQWREAHDPPLSAEEFGARYGEPWPSRTVYGWERHGKIARAKVQKTLAELGVCEPGDWLEAAPSRSSVSKVTPRKAPRMSAQQHPLGPWPGTLRARPPGFESWILQPEGL